MSDHHRLLIRQALNHMQFIEAMIEELDQQIQKKLAPYQKQVELACTVPGISSDAAAGTLAEIGVGDMTDNGPFSSCHHLASWAGVCPGNNSSAGKRKSGKIRKGNRWLKATLTQTAWAGTNKKNSAFQFRYQRLKSRPSPSLTLNSSPCIGCFETVFLINNNVSIWNSSNGNS